MLGPQHGSGASAKPAEKSPPWRGEHASRTAAAAETERLSIPRTTLLAAHVAGVAGRNEVRETPPGIHTSPANLRGSLNAERQAMQDQQDGQLPETPQAGKSPVPKGTMDRSSVDKWRRGKQPEDRPTEGVISAAAASAAETVAKHGTSTTAAQVASSVA